MKKKKKGISRRSFLKAAPAIGVSAVSTKAFNDAHASPLRVPSSEYGREKVVPVLCEMCAQRCPANAYVKDGKVVRMEASPVHEYKLAGIKPEQTSAEKVEPSVDEEELTTS